VEEGGELAGADRESPALGCPAPQQGELLGGHQQAGLPSQEHLLLLLLQINKGNLIFFYKLEEIYQIKLSKHGNVPVPW
jgi:hypothetical protein